MATVNFEELVQVPLGIDGLEAFRRWAQSRDFPESGRIDFVRGSIEVDMSPEDLFTHGALKSEIHGQLYDRIRRLNAFHLFIDRARVSHVAANLSAEPDIVLISQASIDDGRVVLVPKTSGAADRYVEIEGTPELIVEIVSDASVKKDSQRLRAAYHAAGIPEYWLADARAAQLSFRILHHDDDDDYRPADIDDDGYQRSRVLGLRYLLTRRRGLGGFWQYELTSCP